MSHADRPPAAPLNIRFSIRTLLALVAVASLLFAVTNWIGSVWSVSLSLLALIVGAHVFGNAIGTRLRAHGNNTANRRGPDYDEMRRRFAARAGNPTTDHAMLKYDPPSRLVERRSLGRLPAVMTVLGAMLGSGVATVATQFYLSEFGIGDRIVAITSFGVLGALAGFAASSFVQIAVWPAVRFCFRRKS